jgi:hypothetical protein
MSKINVEKILKKHGLEKPDENSKLVERIDYKLIKVAIKEIVKAVVDKCAEEATTKGYYTGINDEPDYDIVDKESILKVKQEINYE